MAGTKVVVIRRPTHFLKDLLYWQNGAKPFGDLYFESARGGGLGDVGFGGSTGGEHTVLGADVNKKTKAIDFVGLVETVVDFYLVFCGVVKDGGLVNWMRREGC